MVEINIPISELQKRKLFVATPMYGGMCTGTYARSMMDLTALCAKNNIQLQCYFLSNESLIQRARNYCCDEFLRSDATHLMFIDADIRFNAQDVIALMALQSDDSPYDVIGAAYPKKCSPSFAKVLTEDGEKTISWIVKNKYYGKVKSMDKNGNFVWKNVVDHFETDNTIGKKWVAVKIPNKKDLYVTTDHDCLVADDVLQPQNLYYTHATNVKNKYMVTNTFKGLNKNSNGYNAAYSKDQLSFLYGTLMGDGSITSKNYLKFGHSTKQSEYLKLKQKLFGGKLSRVKKTGSYKGKEYFGQFLDVPRNSQISKLRELVYIDNKKSIKNIINMIDEKSLAFLYMDDGCRSFNYNTGEEMYVICLEGLSKEDNQLLVELLDSKFNVKSHVTSDNRIYINKNSVDTFFELIAPYVIEELKYKIPEKFHNYSYDYDNVQKLEYGLYEVTDLVYDNDTIRNKCKKLYDITVEDTHNFVSENRIIHNCISWEKIKMAVDKGFADENPNVLERFVGDYVFNPKEGKGEILISEPAQVAEIGTGFMMIRRNVFERYREAFPELSYRPDHARTEHFDGSREIHAYFDCQIQPGTKRYLSEDYFFCYNVENMGGQVWLCPWMQLEHMGSYNFGGSLADLAALGAPATADMEMLKKTKGK